MSPTIERDRLAGDRRLQLELPDAGGERGPVEHLGERVDHRGGTVVDVGMHERHAEQRDAHDEDGREDQELRRVGDGRRVHAHGRGDHEEEGEADAGDHAARREAGAAASDGNRQPGHDRAARAAGDPGADRDHRLRVRPTRPRRRTRGARSAP